MRRLIPSVLGLAALGASALVATGPSISTAGAAPSAGVAAGADGPSKVVVILVDSLSRQVVKKYDMENVQALMRRGTDYPAGTLGHIGAETVVTHNVLTTGALPKNMGWSDEYMRDVDHVLDEGSPANRYFLPGSLTRDQMFALQDHAGYPHLADYLHQADPESVVATVSPKSYAAWGMGGQGSDMIVTFSSRIYDCDGDGTTDLTWRGPDGVNVPGYLANPECGRFYVESSSSIQYDTDQPPAWMYPLDGNRYTVGRDPAHQGGDVWAADAALKIMKREANWSGMLLSLPGLDKAAHMWGGIDDPGGPAPMTHVRRATKVADEQVGRVMTYLRRSGQLDDTLVVLTADHGMQPSRHFYGEDGAGRGDYNWYWGTAVNGEYLDPSAAIEPLIDTGNVDVTFQDGAIRTWLDDRSEQATAEAAEVMEGMPGVTAVWDRVGRHYEKVSHLGRAGMGDLEWAWFQANAQRLVNTAAAPYGPDLIATLRDNSSYGVAGDHGGINRTVQRIPIVFAGAGTTPEDSTAPIRSVDITPTILEILGIEPVQPLDGRPYLP